MSCVHTRLEDDLMGDDSENKKLGFDCDRQKAKAAEQ